eukprot:TRINITY_DN7532_c0_g1_i2.p1 TRINITY_DN7532_c0_g1~~TRINITY_DN7532_c0_g1_i2.p1  ORF type:complete len:531 (-),score=128.18 TRINITY_DN7532_c0_g1_i2:107-1699(-)
MADPPQQPQQQQQQGSIFGLIQRLMFFWMIYNMFFKQGGKEHVDSTGKKLPGHSCLMKSNTLLDMQVYVSERKRFDDFANTENLVWEELDLLLNSNTENYRAKSITIQASEAVMNNASLYAHVFFTTKGHSPDPLSEFYDPNQTIYARKQLNRYLKKPKVDTSRNLLSEDSQLLPVVQTVDEYISYWNENMTFHIVDDYSTHKRGSLPPQITDLMQFDKNGNYYPTVFFNDFWVLKEYLKPLNETTPELVLHMDYSPISLMKWQFLTQMEASFKTQVSMGSSENESEEIKRMFAETNPVLLGITMVVSLLHSVFDFLAFKNDIQFWKNQKSMEGLSVRTVILNSACQLVIFLYLLDNETSWVILISSFVGMLIEFWKVQKAADVKITRTGFFPKITITDRESYIKSETREHDATASKYLYYALIPLVIGYSIYSLIYENHKSWYSWILGSLVGTVYTFGFIMMTPQLFINYKLKSVAHLPWKTFVYKALNTFIDDLFAFIIKMPTLHRLSCFRDGWFHLSTISIQLNIFY